MTQGYIIIPRFHCTQCKQNIKEALLATQEPSYAGETRATDVQEVGPALVARVETDRDYHISNIEIIDVCEQHEVLTLQDGLFGIGKYYTKCRGWLPKTVIITDPCKPC